MSLPRMSLSPHVPIRGSPLVSASSHFTFPTGLQLPELSLTFHPNGVTASKFLRLTVSPFFQTAFSSWCFSPFCQLNVFSPKIPFPHFAFFNASTFQYFSTSQNHRLAMSAQPNIKSLFSIWNSNLCLISAASTNSQSDLQALDKNVMCISV